jgi:hypothetical protein
MKISVLLCPRRSLDRTHLEAPTHQVGLLSSYFGLCVSQNGTVQHFLAKNPLAEAHNVWLVQLPPFQMVVIIDIK